jgi:hypothetical protein
MVPLKIHDLSLSSLCHDHAKMCQGGGNCATVCQQIFGAEPVLRRTV